VWGGEGRREKRRKSNYSAGIIINSQLVPRNYSFEGHRPVGGTNGKEKKKEEENGSFVEKLTTLFPRIVVAIVLNVIFLIYMKEQIIRPTVTLVALFTILRPLFLSSFFSRPSLLDVRYRRFCGPHESFRKICQFEQNRDRVREGKHSPNSTNDEKEKPASGPSKIKEEKRIGKGRETLSA